MTDRTLHPLLEALRSEIVNLAVSVRNYPQTAALSVNSGNWSFPGITRDELAEQADTLTDLIDAYGTELLSLAAHGAIQSVTQRIEFLRNHTVASMWGNSNGIYAYTQTISTSKAILERHLAGPDSAVGEITSEIKRIRGVVQATDASVQATSKRADGLDKKVDEITNAHDTALRLPQTMHDLIEAENAVKALRASIAEDKNASNATLHEIADQAAKASECLSRICIAQTEGDALIKQLDELHRIGTSTVLAGAFQSRARSLERTVYGWLLLLILALFGAVYVGHERAKAVTEVLAAPTVSVLSIFAHCWIGLIGVAAPVWLAWVCTKQIAQRFKLAEDYHYKASISNAYEGYRREALELDGEFRRRLFGTALDRLEELPLRVTERENYGSPMHEAVARPGFWSFLNKIVDCFATRKDTPAPAAPTAAAKPEA